jgi:hypothetical protein
MVPQQTVQCEIGRLNPFQDGLVFTGVMRVETPKSVIKLAGYLRSGYPPQSPPTIIKGIKIKYYLPPIKIINHMETTINTKK